MTGPKWSTLIKHWPLDLPYKPLSVEALSTENLAIFKVKLFIYQRVVSSQCHYIPLNVIKSPLNAVESQ